MAPLSKTTAGRQPSRLPFGLLRPLRRACVALVALSAAPAMAQAVDRDIVIMAVDSSRLPEPDGTGRRAVLRPVGEGVEEVARRLNERGGLLGRRLHVAHDDDRCEAEEAAAIAARAVAQGVDLIIGHVCSTGAIRAAEIYAAAGIVMIAPGPRHPRLTGSAGRRGVHRLAGRDDRQAESIAALITASFPAARVAIIHDRSLQGRGMAEEIRRSAVAAQIAPVLVAAYTSGTKNYAPLVGELAAARVNLIVFPGQPFEASMILDQAHRAGARIVTAIGTDVLAAEAPPARLLAAVDDFIVMLPWPGMGRSPQESTGESVARALAGAALEAWSAALIEAGDVAPERVSDRLRGYAYATRVGALRFDARGDAVVPSYLAHVWREGRWQAWR